jgi:signal peptidase I
MEFKEAIKKYSKAFWNLLWKDDSLKGWVFSIIIIFIFIKLIFFPLLSLTLGTSLPLAIVESCSMYHEGNLLSNFNEWWEDHETKYEDFNISKERFKDFWIKKGLNKGDILLITRANPDKLEVGNIIIFEAGKSNPLIHRIISITEENGQKIFSTIGDNNNGQFSVEKRITQDQLVGKASLKIAPYLGWVKLIFFEASRSEAEKGFCQQR